MDICETATFKTGEYDRHPWELARLKVVVSFLQPLISKQPNARILDLGCGDVFVAESLSNTFTQTTFSCVDTAFTEEYIQHIEKRVDKQRIQLFSSLNDVSEIVENTVDIVLLLDVIEHIEDEIEFLNKLRHSGIINEHTKIVITVPAYQSLFSNHDVYLNHFRRYDTKLLAERIGKAGYAVETTGYFFFSLFLIRKVQKWLQKEGEIDNEKGIGAYTSKGWMDSMVKKILYLDFVIGKALRKTGIRLPGLSCFGICRIQQS
ncbi:MAG: class I SAM-dependent methyltransferase [Brumimicrobium sp.]|nr:class I SAM-dependent methyltransferase [Brumimicrobium sp.]